MQPFASLAVDLIPSLAVALSYNLVNPGHSNSQRKMQQQRFLPWQRYDCVRAFFFKLQSWISNSLRESSKRKGNIFFPVGFGTASSQIQNQLSISLLASGSKADNDTVHGQAGQTRWRRRGSGERMALRAFPVPWKPLSFVA